MKHILQRLVVLLRTAGGCLLAGCGHATPDAHDRVSAHPLEQPDCVYRTVLR